MQVHRFVDAVAVSLSGPTFYMTAADAKIIGRAILDTAEEIAAEIPYAESTVGTTILEEESQ